MRRDSLPSEMTGYESPRHLPSTAKHAPQKAAAELFNRGWGHAEVVAADDGSQKDRFALSLLNHLLFSDRDRCRGADPHRTAYSARGHGGFGHIQQALYAARSVDGLVLSHSLDPGGAGEFRDPDDDRG